MTGPGEGGGETVRGIVVGHGAMAQGLVQAALRISGAEDSALVALSNDGLGPEQLRQAILSDGAGGPTIVFTDLAAGSCTLAARICCAEGAPMAVVTGVNLAMLLDFVFHREVPIPELVERVVERGRSGVRVLSVPTRFAPGSTEPPELGGAPPTDPSDSEPDSPDATDVDQAVSS